MPPSNRVKPSRMVIDAPFRDAKWNLTDGRSVRYEDAPSDATKPGYVLGNRYGRALGMVEAKCRIIHPHGAENRARNYATQLGVPFVFLASGKEICFWDYEGEAHLDAVKTFRAQSPRRQSKWIISVDRR